MIIPFPVHKISLKKKITTELYDTLLDKFVSKLKTDYFFHLFRVQYLPKLVVELVALTSRDAVSL